MRKLIILISVLFPLLLFAQQSEGGKPYTFDLELLGLGKLKSQYPIKHVVLANIDNAEEIRKTDSINKTSKIKSSFYGKILDVNIDLTKDVDPILTEDGKLYLYHVSSPGAYGIQFFFHGFYLPEGTKLFIYNEDKDMILGAFTHKNNNEERHFGTQYIKGNSIILEYFEPFSVNEKANLQMDKAVHVFKSIFATEDKWGQAGNCHIDVACEEDPEWRKMSSSVALILAPNRLLNYTYWCTGTLLNNGRQDKRPLFLSAGHCADTFRISEGHDIERFDYSSWIFIFNYEKENCNDALAMNNNHSVYGAKLLSKDDNHAYDYYTDHLLLELNAKREVLESYNVLFAGWDATEEEAFLSTFNKSIHHPAGDAKKISTGGYLFSVNYGSWENNQWGIYWNQGVTDYGSSGSALFNEDRKLIGQLNGGGSSCEEMNRPDYYSKFSLTYEYANLDQWLDPESKGITTLGSLYDENDKIEKSDPITFIYNDNGNNFDIIINYPLDPHSLIFFQLSNIAGQVIFEKGLPGSNHISIQYPLATGIYFMQIEFVKVNNHYDLETEKVTKVIAVSR